MNLMKKIRKWLDRKNLACEIKLLLDSGKVLGEKQGCGRTTCGFFFREKLDTVYMKIHEPTNRT